MPGQAHRRLNSKAPMSAEQMEMNRLKAERARVKIERDVAGKATAYFAKGLIEVRLHSSTRTRPHSVAALADVDNRALDGTLAAAVNPSIRFS